MGRSALVHITDSTEFTKINDESFECMHKMITRFGFKKYHHILSPTNSTSVCLTIVHNKLVEEYEYCKRCQVGPAQFLYFTIYIKIVKKHVGSSERGYRYEMMICISTLTTSVSHSSQLVPQSASFSMHSRDTTAHF